MIIDDTFMWLYWFYKVGGAFFVLEKILLIFSISVAAIGIFLFSLGKFGEEKAVENMGAFLLSKLYFLIPLTVFVLLVSSFAPSKDELKAYAAYRIGEKVVTSDEANRLMNAALLYLEGKAKGE